MPPCAATRGATKEAARTSEKRIVSMQDDLILVSRGKLDGSSSECDCRLQLRIKHDMINE